MVRVDQFCSCLNFPLVHFLRNGTPAWRINHLSALDLAENAHHLRAERNEFKNILYLATFLSRKANNKTVYVTVSSRLARPQDCREDVGWRCTDLVFGISAIAMRETG
jgi:hypothetical protein